MLQKPHECSLCIALGRGPGCVKLLAGAGALLPCSAGLRCVWVLSRPGAAGWRRHRGWFRRDLLRAARGKRTASGGTDHGSASVALLLDRRVLQGAWL
jgi:hypothetical protein